MLITGKTKYLIFFFISVLLYFTHVVFTNHGIYGDGNGYYTYANSLFFQKNLDLDPIYNHLSNFTGKNYIFSRIFWDTNQNPFSIGTALTWIPSLQFISIINAIFGLGADRFNLLYELGPGISGIIFIITGLIFLEKYLLNFFSQKAVGLTIIAIFFGTNLFYYSALEPALSHQPSFFIISFLLWWTYKFKRTKYNLILLGLLSGFLATVRIADIILLIPIILQARLRPKDMIFYLPGILAGYSPQLINQYFSYGSMFFNPYISGGNGTWQPGITRIFEFLFSPMRGLFLWTPLYLLGFFGLLDAKKKVFLWTLLILTLISSSWSAYLSAGFGQRFAFSAIPIFAYGITKLFNNIYIKKTIFIIFACIVWNFLLVKNVYLHKDLFIQSSDFNYNQFIKYMVRIN